MIIRGLLSVSWLSAQSHPTVTESVRRSLALFARKVTLDVGTKARRRCFGSEQMAEVVTASSHYACAVNHVACQACHVVVMWLSDGRLSWWLRAVFHQVEFWKRSRPNPFQSRPWFIVSSSSYISWQISLRLRAEVCATVRWTRCWVESLTRCEFNTTANVLHAPYFIVNMIDHTEFTQPYLILQLTLRWLSNIQFISNRVLCTRISRGRKPSKISTQIRKSGICLGSPMG